MPGAATILRTGPTTAVRPVCTLGGVEKRRVAGGVTFSLRIDRLEIRAGTRLSVVGPSGSGKSTLLALLALALQPDACGSFAIAPASRETLDIAAMWRDGRSVALAHVRRRHLGYVPQSGGLLSFLDVRDNILLPSRANGRSASPRFAELVERLGLARHLSKRPGELSIGERQRVAIARALAHEPAMVIADEPTASLDPVTGAAVMALFAELIDRGCCAIMATHAEDLATRHGFASLRLGVTAAGEGEIRAVLEGDAP